MPPAPVSLLVTSPCSPVFTGETGAPRQLLSRLVHQTTGERAGGPCHRLHLLSAVASLNAVFTAFSTGGLLLWLSHQTAGKPRCRPAFPMGAYAFFGLASSSAQPPQAGFFSGVDRSLEIAQVRALAGQRP